MVSVGGRGGFSILIITVTAQRVCMPAQKEYCQGICKTLIYFCTCQHGTAVSLLLERGLAHVQCIVWKGLKELPLQRKLVCLIVHISDNLMEATYQKSQSTAMLPDNALLISRP